MKKLLAMVLALTLFAASSALAVTDAQRSELATKYLPAGVQFVKEELDDGLISLEYVSEDRTAEYDLKLDQNGNAFSLSYDLYFDRGGASAKLSEAEVFDLIKALYPDATNLTARLEMDDMLYEYKVFFTTPTLSAEYQLNAESGQILEYKLHYTVTPATGAAVAAPVADANSPAGIIAAKYPGASVIHVELDYDDGMQIYEGKASYNGMLYDFEINAANGAIIEWKIDD